MPVFKIPEPKSDTDTLTGGALAQARDDIILVADEAAMLALDVQVGDAAKRTDTGDIFWLRAEPASVLANWEYVSDYLSAAHSVKVNATASPATPVDLVAPASRILARLSAGSIVWADAGDIQELLGENANVVTPATIVGDQDDYGPAGFNTSDFLRLSSTTNVNITGFDHTNVTGHRRKVVVNINASNSITLKREDAASLAVNRIAIKTDVKLDPDQAVEIWYDPTSARWRLTSKE